MNSRKVVYLFKTTLGIGTTAGFLIGLILDWQTHINDLAAGQLGGIITVLITAAIWTVIAQMGFLAYLTIHRFGLGIFRSAKLWNKVQVVFIAFVLFDLMFFRHMLFAEEGESMLGYAITPILLLIYGLVVAYFKSKDTNQSAFIPTVFFMVVVSTVEWIPALRENDFMFLLTAIAPILIANTWQILILHRLHEKDPKEEERLRKRLENRKNPQPS